LYYPAFRRLDVRSGLAAFFSALRFPPIGKSISFCPATAFRGFLALLDASPAMLCLSASIRFTTLSARGRGFGPIIRPLRLALINSVSASS